MLKINKFKNISFFLLAGFLLVLFVISVAVFAEDDDEDEYEHHEGHSDPEITIDTSTAIVTFSDSDGDGLLDENDPHPSIAEIYIVKDDNLNGIVDDFEEIEAN